ncbi:hypothetical protein AC579_3621 [Pseudocercospora musae]|uniref:Uncharacterized protein n=1 Tax=Pseudocercospora musae TaxID=113226 RepID=A0A139ISH5_9PEZI|nr:hypothetical protein AC579_3621 [Pseudocercospora musae]
MAPRSSSSPAPILRLPLELRQQIYAHLLPLENVSHPLPSVGITSVSHRPPSTSLLNIHTQFTDEILDYFYTISTWKLVFSHAFNFFRVDPELRRLESSPSLNQIRKVEVVFFCDVLLLQNYPSFGLESFCAEIKRRASRACDVLCQAANLRTVVISWCDSTHTGNWSEKAKIVEPLKKLSRQKPDLNFRIGKITAEDTNREAFAEALQNVLGTVHRIDDSYDGTDESSSRLRMLAFDVRQDRMLASGHPNTYSISLRGRSGWRGARPALTIPLEVDERANEG